ncbi:hypothetical protein CFK44_24785, partial [Escherichia coli O157]|uniref:hypothetical protein n=1 Tax=Escherichia coli TaxID=562 RepID=UPI000D8E4A6D
HHIQPIRDITPKYIHQYLQKIWNCREAIMLMINKCSIVINVVSLTLSEASAQNEKLKGDG